MNKALIKELNKYQLRNVEDYKNAIKEILQSIVLIGLSKTNFFNECCFYGGTCLRIFYGLDRFSEDLDFTLLSKNSSFVFNKFFEPIKIACEQYGFVVELIEKNIDIENRNIARAYLKVNTRKALINCECPKLYLDHIQNEEKLQIKLEADIESPTGFKFEAVDLNFDGENFPIRILDAESLLAGKIHAILYRQYSRRVKGRDYYDFIYLVNKNVSINLIYLKNKILKSDKDYDLTKLDLNSLKTNLIKKINNINMNQVNEDIEPFINHLSHEVIIDKSNLLDCVYKLE